MQTPKLEAKPLMGLTFISQRGQNNSHDDRQRPHVRQTPDGTKSEDPLVIASFTKNNALPFTGGRFCYYIF